MDSKKLEILMTAVDLGSFSRAAEVVGYTQSGLTHLVDSLEREIGLTLVRRDHSGISLTGEGEALMPAIREFLRANARLENQIFAITDKSAQTIRVAAYASIAMRWMPEILYRFRRICPHIDVDLRTSTMNSSRSSCWKSGRRTLFSPLGRAASPATGHRCITTRCTPFSRLTIRRRAGRSSRSKNSAERSF